MQHNNDVYTLGKKKLEHNTIVLAPVFHDLKSKTKGPFLSNIVHKSKTLL